MDVFVNEIWGGLIFGGGGRGIIGILRYVRFVRFLEKCREEEKDQTRFPWFRFKI